MLYFSKCSINFMLYFFQHVKPETQGFFKQLLLVLLGQRYPYRVFIQANFNGFLTLKAQLQLTTLLFFYFIYFYFFFFFFFIENKP